jgi:hypothetical protein
MKCSSAYKTYHQATQQKRYVVSNPFVLEGEFNENKNKSVIVFCSELTVNCPGIVYYW